MTEPIHSTRLHGAFSRRTFIRGVAVGSLGLAGAALIGCDSDDEAPGNSGTPGASGTAALGSASVLGLWGSEELASANAMFKPWEDRTGGDVEFTGTRDITAVLTSRVEGNNAPDIAIPAEVGLFRRFAEAGKLQPLSACGVDQVVNAEYPQSFVDLGTIGGTLYGLFMKADTKGTIWYSPKVFEQRGWEPLTAKSTFADLEALANKIKADGLAPWSIGVESEGASGWPGTDWIQQILLNEAGAEVYDGLVDGSVKFTDPRVKQAWEAFGRMALGEGMTAQGGATGNNATNFQDSAYAPFESTPTAAMVYLGGFASAFIADQFPSLKAGEDYDFFPWPGGGVTGGANVAYAFNNNATTCSLLEYLASAEAQSIWVERGGFTSVNSKVGLDAYPDPIAKKQAEQLTSAEVFRFDLDDAIGGDTQQAYFTGVTEYLKDPGKLDSILSSIEATRT